MEELAREVPVAGVTLRASALIVERTRPTILFANAVGMDSRLAWRLSDAVSAAGYNFVTWDLRCSPGPGRAWDDCKLATHAQDADAVMSAFGLREVIAMGWCTGASIAAAFAAAYPRKTQALLLVDGAFLFDRTPGRPLGDAMFAMCKAIRDDRSTASAFHQLAKPSGTEGRTLGLEGDRELLAQVLKPYSGDVETLVRYASAICESSAYDPRPVLAQIACPTLLIAGTEDKMVSPRNSERAARRLQDAELKLMDRGDHYSLFTDPRVLGTLLSFSDRLQICDKALPR